MTLGRRIRLGLILLFLGGLTFLVFLLVLDLQVHVSLLRDKNLPVTWEHIGMSRSLTSVPDPIKWPEGKPSAMFTSQLSYTDLLKDGTIQVSICQEPMHNMQAWPERLSVI